MNMAGVIPPLLPRNKSKRTADVILPRNLDPAGFPVFSGKELTEAKKTARQHLEAFLSYKENPFSTNTPVFNGYSLEF